MTDQLLKPRILTSKFGLEIVREVFEEQRGGFLRALRSLQSASELAEQ